VVESGSVTIGHGVDDSADRGFFGVRSPNP